MTSNPQDPLCYRCVHRRTNAHTHHSGCASGSASVTGSPHGVRNGWFVWPINFDPVWLESCSGFSEGKSPETEFDLISWFLERASYITQKKEVAE